MEKRYLATDSLQSWTSVEHHLVQSFIFLSLLFSIAVSQISYSVHLLEWITQLKLNEEELGADTFYSNLIERTKAVLFGLWIDDVYPQRLPEVFIQKSIPIKGKLWMWIEYEPFQEIFFIMFNLNSMSIYIKFYLYYVIFFETSTGLIKKGWGHYEMDDINQFHGVPIIIVNMSLTARGWCNDIIMYDCMGQFLQDGEKVQVMSQFF